MELLLPIGIFFVFLHSKLIEVGTDIIILFIQIAM